MGAIFLRFCLTRNGLLFPIWLATAFCVRSWAGVLLGVLFYYLLESKFHADMHGMKWSPFFRSHERHHHDPTPESGVPELWVFVAYALISVVTYPFLYLNSVWFGVLSLLCVYEWIHYLCHCPYKPRTRYGWMVRVNHNLHHKFDDTTRFNLLFPKKT